MLIPSERLQVVEDLANYLLFSRRIDDFITVTFPQPLRREFEGIPVTLTIVADQAAWVVDTCLAHRWKAAPSLLERLLVPLVRGGFARLQPFLDRVRAGVDPNPDPFGTFWVLADQPFLDRDNLRTRARQLMEEPAQPILRVNGPSKSGKTYTTELLSYVARDREHIHVVHVELPEGQGPSYELRDLAESLTLTMPRLTPFEGAEDPGHRCRWVVSNACRNDGLWVFVLDGFGQPQVSEEVLAFIRLLSQTVAKLEVARKLRLVLLHFDWPFTGNWRAKTLDETLTPQVARQDVIDCLVQLNNHLQATGQSEKAIHAAEIPKLADALVARAVVEPIPLQCLYDELRALV